MKLSFFRALIPLTVAVSATGWSAIITSGTVQSSPNGPNFTNSINIAGPNLAINVTSAFPALLNVSTPLCGLGQPTCTYNFSQTASISNASPGGSSVILSLISNGNTYTNNGSCGNFTGACYQLLLNLTFSSSSATVPQINEFDPMTGFPTRSVAQWSAVPFTATGNYTVTFFPGGAAPSVVASDTLTGSGFASGNTETRQTGAGAATIAYRFTSTPEPGTAGLVGGAILLGAAFLRKRKA